MMRLVCIPFVAALCACSVAPSNPYDSATPVAKQARGSVSGTVSLQGSVVATPLSGAGLTLSGSGGSAGQTTTSDGNGVFTFTGIVPGSYTITATHASAYPTSAGVTLTAGGAQSVALLLPFASSGSGATGTEATLSVSSPALTVSVNAQSFTSSAQLLARFNVTGATTMVLACGTNVAQQATQAFAPVAVCALPSTPGMYTVAVNFADALGNASTTSLQTVYYDPTAPTPPLVAGVGTTTANTTVSLALAAAATDAAVPSDPGGPRFLYQVRGAQYADWTDC